jgi:hypothetical protein
MSKAAANRKYHISPKTGRAGLCSAAHGNCPFGASTPHFPDKQASNDYIEQELKQQRYSFTTTSKSASQFIANLMEIPESENSWGVNSYLQDGLRAFGYDLKIGETIEAPDYINYTVLSKDEENFLLETSGGEYSSYKVLEAHKVKLMKSPLIRTESKEIDNTQDYPNINKMLKEVMEHDPPALPDNRWAYNGRVFRDGQITVGEFANREIVRPDGTKILCFNIPAEGDRKFTDEPFPVDSDVRFSENGHRQNAREMDIGACIYDTRTGEGIVLKYLAGSEGNYQHSSFEWNGEKLLPETPNPVWREAPGDIYVIKATGEVDETSHYKII